MADVAGLAEHQVELWLRWLSKWNPPPYQNRLRWRVCQQCPTSPFLRAAGVGAEVPHQVKHALHGRMAALVSRLVVDYGRARLPILKRELDKPHGRRGPSSRFDEDADPSVFGLDIDPIPAQGEVVLFSLQDFGDEPDAGHADDSPAGHKLQGAEAREFRRELAELDRYSDETGAGVCSVLSGSRNRIHEALREYVEPQIQQILAGLSHELEIPL